MVLDSSILGPIHFLWNINDGPDDNICNIIIFADAAALYSKFNIASDFWQQLELTSELESDLQDTANWGRRWPVDFNVCKTQLFCLTGSLNTGVIDMKVNGSVDEEESL